MSLSSVTSRIVEEVSSALLEYSGFSTSEILDYGSSEENEIPTRIKNPFSFNVHRFLPNCQIMDLDRFIEVAAELIEDAQNREGVVSDEQVELIEDYPAERFDRFGEEVVAWKLISRKPANMSRDGKGRPQQGYTHYYKIRSADHPNKFLEVEARPVDHVIEFQCWSKSARLANRRALWLERLFINHAWAFLVQGADRFRFQERLADWYTVPSGQHLYVRPLRFFIRAYEFRTKADSVIKNINFEIGSMSSNELANKGY